jgi:predicted nucleotidyltransferase
MQNTKEILDAIRQSKQHLTSMFKLREVGVFGSVIREEQRDGSDIDVLVNLGAHADLLDLIGIVNTWRSFCTQGSMSCLGSIATGIQ